MGGHYGSVQVRSGDREAVKAAAEKVARSKKIQALLGPVINGWIGLYPEGNGQDESVGREVAELTGGYVVHLLVHDDDIFAYWLYHDGRLIDSYWSAPGYFGEENLAAEEKMTGRPEAFEPLIKEGVAQLGALLARDEGGRTFESERLNEFAKLLGIANAVQAYEYLQEDDHGGVKGWRKFEEIPNSKVEEERSQAREEKARVGAEVRKLRKEGMLLLREERKEHIAYGCRMGEGFLAAWPDHVKRTVAFCAYERPWEAGKDVVLATPAHVTGVASDSAGSRIAIAAGDRVQIWDVSAGEMKHIVDIAEGDLAISVAISGDGKRVAHASRKEMVISDATGGKSIAVVPVSSHRSCAFHPSGEWVAAAGNTLGLICVDEGPHWRDLFIGGKSSGAAAVQLMMRETLKGIDLDAMEKQQRAAMEKSEATMRNMGKRSKNEAFTEENLARAKEIMEKYMVNLKAQLTALKEGTLPLDPPQANEGVLCAGFSRDGRWLFCSTNMGLRVYEWSLVPREAGSTMPPAVWKFDIPRDALSYLPSQIHAMAEEVDASALIFACGSKIHRLDLSSGETRELLQLPGNSMAYQLVMSADGATLGVASRVLPPSAARSRTSWKQLWDVWSLSRIRGALFRSQE